MEDFEKSSEQLDEFDEFYDEDEIEEEYPEEIVRLADEILSAMEKLPEGTELTAATAIELTRHSQSISRRGNEIYYLYEGLVLNQNESWELSFALTDRAEEHSLLLDSSEWDGAAIGTPENIPFRVRHLDYKA